MHKQQLEVNIDHDQCHNPAKSKLNQTTTWKRNCITILFYVYYNTNAKKTYYISTEQ
jgi:hypothetical protein